MTCSVHIASTRIRNLVLHCRSMHSLHKFLYYKPHVEIFYLFKPYTVFTDILFLNVSERNAEFNLNVIAVLHPLHLSDMVLVSSTFLNTYKITLRNYVTIVSKVLNFLPVPLRESVIIGILN